MIKKCLAILIGILLALQPVYVLGKDEVVSALAMHGAPKYGPHFDHFDYANPQAPQGGTLQLGVVGTFDSLNPFIVKGQPAEGLNGQPGRSSLIYQSLMARSWDEPFSLYGLIAKSVKIPEDRSWIEFTLRPQARWSDGQPLAVADVLFSWEILRKQGRPNHRSYYNRVAKAEQIGPYTVRFTFVPPATGTIFDRELPLIIGLMPILPQHMWKNKSFQSTTLEPPLGSGPYEVSHVEPGRRIVYTRVKNWWAEGLPVVKGLYNFETIQFDYYRDEEVALEAFRAGAYDLRQEYNTTLWATAYDSPAVHKGTLILKTFPHHRPAWMRALIFNTRRPLFQNRLVRKALTEVFDFEWMNKTLFHNAYQRINSYYPNSELAVTGLPSTGEKALLLPFKDQLPPEVLTQAFQLPVTDGRGPVSLRSHLRKAQAWLVEAGWRLEDGRLVDKAGKPFTFNILLNDPKDERLALEFSRTLERLGIQASVRTVDSAQYQARLNNFDFDMTVNKWISTLSPGNEQITFWGSEYADLPGSRNYAGIRSPVVDALAQSIATASTRQDLLNRVRALDRVLLWGYYVIPLYYDSGDHVAYWNKWYSLQHPENTPLYGYVLDAWWREGP